MREEGQDLLALRTLHADDARGVLDVLLRELNRAVLVERQGRGELVSRDRPDAARGAASRIGGDARARDLDAVLFEFGLRQPQALGESPPQDGCGQGAAIGIARADEEHMGFVRLHDAPLRNGPFPEDRDFVSLDLDHAAGDAALGGPAVEDEVELVGELRQHLLRGAGRRFTGEVGARNEQRHARSFDQALGEGMGGVAEADQLVAIRLFWTATVPAAGQDQRQRSGPEAPHELQGLRRDPGAALADGVYARDHHAHGLVAGTPLEGVQAAHRSGVGRRDRDAVDGLRREGDQAASAQNAPRTLEFFAQRGAIQDS